MGYDTEPFHLGNELAGSPLHAHESSRPLSRPTIRKSPKLARRLQGNMECPRGRYRSSARQDHLQPEASLRARTVVSILIVSSTTAGRNYMRPRRGCWRLPADSQGHRAEVPAAASARWRLRRTRRLIVFMGLLSRRWPGRIPVGCQAVKRSRTVRLRSGRYRTRRPLSGADRLGRSRPDDRGE